MKDLLFDSWHQWKVCFLSGCKKFGWGIMRIITCIILGILSIIRAIWRMMVGFVRNNPSIALGGAFVICFIVWLLTFATMRARAVGAEWQLDSIKYEYTQFKKGHGYE